MQPINSALGASGEQWRDLALLVSQLAYFKIPLHDERCFRCGYLKKHVINIEKQSHRGNTLTLFLCCRKIRVSTSALSRQHRFWPVNSPAWNPVRCSSSLFINCALSGEQENELRQKSHLFRIHILNTSSNGNCPWIVHQFRHVNNQTRKPLNSVCHKHTHICSHTHTHSHRNPSDIMLRMRG